MSFGEFWEWDFFFVQLFVTDEFERGACALQGLWRRWRKEEGGRRVCSDPYLAGMVFALPVRPAAFPSLQLLLVGLFLALKH